MKNNIKVQRAIHDMTQADLAEKIGVSRQTINAMEKNKYVPSTVLSLKIAKLLIASGSSYARTSLSDVYQSEFVNGGQETYSTITINSFNSLRDNGIAAGDAGNSLLSSGTGGGFERGDWLEISNMNDESWAGIAVETRY